VSRRKPRRWPNIVRLTSISLPNFAKRNKFVRAGAEPMTIKGRLKTTDYARPNRGIDYPDGRQFRQEGYDLNMLKYVLFCILTLCVGVV